MNDKSTTDSAGQVQPESERHCDRPIRACTVLGRGGKGHDTDKPKVLIEYDL